jgi:Bax protein
VKFPAFNYLFLCLILAIIFYSCDEFDYRYEIRVQNIHLDSFSQVIPVIDSIVVPVLYDTLLINNLSSISEKRQQFINQVLPAILIVKFYEQQKFNRIEALLSQLNIGKALTKNEQLFLDSLLLRYNADSYKNLLERLKPNPTSLILAQAAIESGWGQSRFALEGNNLFGIRATPHDKEFQKSFYNRGGSKITFKRYSTVSESIEHYLFTIGKNQAYSKFRTKRFKEANIFRLIDELNKYSEKGNEYSKMLKHIIDWNDLVKYDAFRIDDNFIMDRKCICYFTEKLLNRISLISE